METQLIEYVRKSGRKPKRDDDGNIIVKGNGSSRAKKGVMYCGVTPDSDDRGVDIGFSLCSPMDEFDVVNGNKEPGFGLGLAQARADKWGNFTGYFIQTSWTEDQIENGDDLYVYENPNPQEIVEIPPSIYKQLREFIARCRRYFRDKEFPLWVENIENGNYENCPLVNLYDSIDSDDDTFVLRGIN